MITYQKAFALASDEIKRKESASHIPLKIIENETISEEFGYVFFYQSKKFVETGDFNSMLGGNAPIIVDKESEQIVITGTGKDIDFYIELYKKYRNDIELFHKMKRQ